MLSVQVLMINLECFSVPNLLREVLGEEIFERGVLFFCVRHVV